MEQIKNTSCLLPLVFYKVCQSSFISRGFFQSNWQTLAQLSAWMFFLSLLLTRRRKSLTDIIVDLNFDTTFCCFIQVWITYEKLLIYQRKINASLLMVVAEVFVVVMVVVIENLLSYEPYNVKNISNFEVSVTSQMHI